MHFYFVKNVTKPLLPLLISMCEPKVQIEYEIEMEYACYLTLIIIFVVSALQAGIYRDVKIKESLNES